MILLLWLLCACGQGAAQEDPGTQLRTALLGAGQCSFQLELEADYGTYLRTFTLDCQGNGEEMTLTVLAPEAAQGITATVQGEEATVAFEDTVLGVEDFSSRRISPLAAPYLLVRAWTQGYLAATGQDGQWQQVTYRLGYGQQQLEIETYFSDGVPQWAEISDGQQALITCNVTQLTLG